MELINLMEYPVKNVLSTLLKDKTTRKNIIFATDAYSEYNIGARDRIMESVRLKYGVVAIQGRDVLVAMQFGRETQSLREAIKLGIRDAGYNPVLIDEVEHNEFITPELLSYIRRSKFVVVDLTHQNNGAYFEEGYAMGLGKTVIQLCKKDTKLHFDIAQKNTIMWETESEIPLKLKNRITATID